MREYDKREEVYMSMVVDEGDDDTDQEETTIREGTLADKVETLVEAINGGELLIQDTGAGTGAKRKNQFQGQFQNQSVAEQLREVLDIPTICLMYKSLLRYVSNDRQMMGQARDVDEKALRGCHQLLEAVSGQDPVKWFGHEEGQIVNMILNVTDQEMANNYTQMSDVTRDLSALAKYQKGGGEPNP